MAVSTTTLFKQLAISVGVSAALVGTAMADPVGAFDYTQEFEFIEPITPEGIDKSGATIGGGNVDGSTKLEWGTPKNDEGNRSSIVINPTGIAAPESQTPSNVLTAGEVQVAFGPNAINQLDFAAGPVLVHNNFVIRGTSLDNAKAQDYIQLTPIAGEADGFGTSVQEVTFDVNFKETDNNIDDQGNGDGTPCSHFKTDAEFGCGDIFALSGGLLTEPVDVNDGAFQAFLLDTFVRGDYAYDVYITAPGLGLLPEAACLEADAGLDCIGFTTFENQVNAFQLAFAVLAREIPVPATLLLFGGSLLSMAWFRRRKAVA